MTRLGLLQDGNVGVAVVPKREEILIRGSCFGAVALPDASLGSPRRISGAVSPLTNPRFSNMSKRAAF